MSDWLNPIFVLKTRRFFASLRKYGPLLFILYLFYGFLACYFFSTHDVYGDFESFIILEYACVALFSFIFSATQIDTLPKRYIEEDLIHYTALSDKQVLFGYVYVGTFYSGLVCLCGTLVHLPLLPWMGMKGLIPLANFFAFFLISQMVNLFAASFFAGVRKRYQFILMGFSMYVMFFILFGSFLSHWYSPSDFFEFLTEHPFAYWKFAAFYALPVSLCAYGLILWNLQKTCLAWKMIRTLLAYTILAGVLYLLRFLVEH